MDFPTFPPHFPNTDYLFYPSLRPSSAFSIASPASFLFDSDQPVSLAGTRPGTACSERSRQAPAAVDKEAQSVAASWRRRRSSKKRAADIEAEDRRERYEYLILFFPGNPGVIGYYRPFLSKLSELLQQNVAADGVVNEELENREKPPVSILGISHAGFSIYDRDDEMFEENMEGEEGDFVSIRKKSRWTNWGSPPYSLRQQIEMKVEFTKWIYEWYRQRQDHLSTIRNKDGDTKWKRKRLKIIYLAHSVGGYIVLETVRLFNHQKKIRQNELAARDWYSQLENEEEMDIVGGILLFPTIQDIALSKQGKIFTPVVTRIPKVHKLGKILTYLLLYIIPSAWFRWIVGKVTGFLKKPQPKSRKKLDEQHKKMIVEEREHLCYDRNNDEMLGVTMGFLQSKYGVEEALYMCRDEMLEIKEEKWDEEIWGAPSLALATSGILPAQKPGSQQFTNRISNAANYRRNGNPFVNEGIRWDEDDIAEYCPRIDDNVNTFPSRRSWRISASDNATEKKRLKLVMYFGKDDNWVANQTRDSLIKLRGRRFQPQHPSTSGLRQRRPSSSSFARSNRGSTATINRNPNELQIDGYIDSGYADDNDSATCATDYGEDYFAAGEDPFLSLEKYKPQMIICKDGLPHGFCIAHGEIMATKVFGWVEEMIMAEEYEHLKREKKKEGR